MHGWILTTIDSADAQFVGGHLGHCVGELQLVRGRWYRLELDTFVRTQVPRGGGGEGWSGRCRPTDVRVALTAGNKRAATGRGAHSNAGSRSEIRRWIGQHAIKFELSVVLQAGLPDVVDDGGREGGDGDGVSVGKRTLSEDAVSRLDSKQTAVRVWARQVNSDGTKFRVGSSSSSSSSSGADGQHNGGNGPAHNLAVDAELRLVYENLESLTVPELKRLLTSHAASTTNIGCLSVCPLRPLVNIPL